jgi:hypothetical protein
MDKFYIKSCLVKFYFRFIFSIKTLIFIKFKRKLSIFFKLYHRTKSWYIIQNINVIIKIYKFYLQPILMDSSDNSVGIALGYGLDDRDSRVRFPAGAGNFSLHHRVQNGSGAHPTSHPVGTRVYFPGGKAAGA